MICLWKSLGVKCIDSTTSFEMHKAQELIHRERDREMDRHEIKQI